MLKYLMMAGIVSALFAVSSPVMAKESWKKPGCKRVTVNLQVVEAVWVGCKFKWWGAAFVPGEGPSGEAIATSSPSSGGHSCGPRGSYGGYSKGKA